MKKLTIIAFLIVVLMACAPIMPAPDQPENETEEVEVEGNETVEEKTEEKEEKTEEVAPPADNRDLPVKEVVEGDLVNFPKLKAVDPDGDLIIYTFSGPLNERGEWQTVEGDVGEHLVTITASDGVNTVTQQVLIRVLSRNKPPVIELEGPIEAIEGESVTIEPIVTDPDGDEVNVSISGWMNGTTRSIGFDDAGLHKVIIAATDGSITVSKEVIISVQNVNRPPTLSELSAVKILEGQKVTIRPKADDPDTQNLSFTFDFPLNENGSWQSETGDAGEYEVLVMVTDGELTAEQTVVITVDAVNKAPVIELDDTASVKEGEVIVLNPIVTDPEGDEVRVTFSGWMTSSEKQTTYEDSGNYKVTVTARDRAGNEAEVEVLVSVEEVNRVPIFGAGSFT